jgi:peptidoglycan/xylan/chitin deacetylase (PgdA/CDA1 family)
MFRLISFFSVKEIPTHDKIIYLTFDDGPEPDITEYVLDILKQYNAKATFFCIGENFEKYPDLVKSILKDDHALGNHTYYHTNGLKTDKMKYIDEVGRTKKLIKTNLFRPPWGALTLSEFFEIRKTNKIIMWSINSNDTNPKTNWNKHCDKMLMKTKNGSIILFHFGEKHANSTKVILFKYIDEVYKLGYNFESIKI